MWVAVVAIAVGLVIFLAYYLVYPRHGIRMPLGFDTSWYIWRSRFVGSQGIGPLGTAARPGSALLAAILGSVSGRSQLQLAVLMPLVLVSVFALSIGAFVERLSPGRTAGWAIAAIVAGVLLGTTRLVSENVANLLNLALVVAAVAVLSQAVAGRSFGPSFWGAVVLIVGAGLAHWLFLGVMAVIFAIAMALAFPSSLRSGHQGVPAARTESGMLAAFGVASGAALGVLVGAVLRAPFRTFEVEEDHRRYLPKFRTDLHRLAPALTLPVAAAGAAAIVVESRSAAEPASAMRRRFLLHVLAAWAIGAGVGVVFGAVTRRLPPHRFLALVVAVPVTVCIAAAVLVVARWLKERVGAATAAVATLVALAIVAAPGMAAWYRHGPGVWLDAAALEQSETAARYVISRPPDAPIVFDVSPLGSGGVLTAALAERTIRAGMPPDRQVDVHIYAGDPADLLAGRRSLTGRPRVDAATLRLWEDVRPVLPARPPILILEALARPQYAKAKAELGGEELAPGILLLRGPRPSLAVMPAPVLNPVPSTFVAATWAAVLLALLLAAGWGWTTYFLGSAAPPHLRACISPAVGAAVAMISALVASKLGVRVGATGGVVSFVLASVAGFAADWSNRRSEEAIAMR
jgi:hypothetical protein